MSRSYHDKKPWNKPPKSFKQVQKRHRRAQERQALREGREIPQFKQTDQWDWT